MEIKTFGTVRCSKCDKDLTDKIQIYDYMDKEHKYRVTYCEDCNAKISDSYD